MSTTSDDHIALALRRPPPGLPQSPHSGRRGVRAPARILPTPITHRPHRVPAIALTQRPHPGDKSASPIPCAACCVAPRSQHRDLCAAQICALASLQLAVTRRRALGPRLGEILAPCRVPAPHSSDLLHCLAAGCRPPSSGRPRASLPPRPSLRTTRSASILPSPPPSPSPLRRNCTPPLLTRHADCALHLGSLASLHRAARHSTHQGPLPTPSFRLLHHKSSSHHTAGNVSTERSRQPTQCASSTTAHTSSVDDALLSSHDSGLSLPDAQPPVAAAPPPPGSPMLGRHTKGRPQLAQMRSLPREMRVFV